MPELEPPAGAFFLAHDGARAIGANDADGGGAGASHGVFDQSPTESAARTITQLTLFAALTRARGCSTCSIGLVGAAAAGRTIRW
jgi:hypothetical protein